MGSVLSKVYFAGRRVVNAFCKFFGIRRKEKHEFSMGKGMPPLIVEAARPENQGILNKEPMRVRDARGRLVMPYRVEDQRPRQGRVHFIDDGNVSTRAVYGADTWERGAKRFEDRGGRGCLVSIAYTDSVDCTSQNPKCHCKEHQPWRKYKPLARVF